MTPDGLTRRALLRRGVAAGLAAAVAGCQFREEAEPTETVATDRRSETPPPTETTPTSRQSIEEAYGDSFGEIVNVVEAGAAPDGSQPIDAVLGEVLADDTLVYFPPGTYRVRSFASADLTNAGLVGESPATTRVVPAERALAIDHQFLRFQRVADFLFEGFTLDYRASGYGGATQVFSSGDFAVRNLRVAGRMPDESVPDSPAAFRFDVREPSASGTVENLALPDGGHDGANAIGLYVGKDHAGTLSFVDCEVARFPNNGLYASAPGRDEPGFRGRDGTVHVRGGHYANNNVANVRLGSTGSTARDVTIRVNERPPTFLGELNVRGLRVRNKSDQLVENCDIAFGADAGYGFGGVVLHPNAGSVTVRDTTISVNRDGMHAIRAIDDGSPGALPGLTVENVTVTGSASGGWVAAIAGREDVTFTDCAIRQTGVGRNGVSFVNCGTCLVDGGEIHVTGIPVQGRGSRVETRGVTTGTAVERRADLERGM